MAFFCSLFAFPPSPYSHPTQTPWKDICVGILKTELILFGLFAAAFYLFFNEVFMKSYIVHFSACCNSKCIYY